MKDPRSALDEGIRLFRMTRWEPALAEFLALDPAGFSAEENAELAYYLGLCYAKLEHYDDAIVYLDQVIALSPNPLRLYQCRMALAYVYVITGRFKPAEFELGRLMSGGFESVQMYTTMAFAAWSQRHFQKAVDNYEKALALDENSTTALNGLGFILADSEIDVARGLRLCRKAVDLKPQNAAYLDSLGWAHFKNGQTEEARNWLRRAMEAAPHQKEIREHMKTVITPGTGN
jgi:tetratricopeptide (TPR) repeat protein